MGVGHAVVGGQRSHQSVSKPFQGEVRTTSQAKSFGSPIASVASSDSVSNTAQSGLASHLGQGAVVGGVAHGVVGHGLAHGVVGHGIAHPVAHAVAHPVAHAIAEVSPDEISPFTYQYAVADDYSGSNFQAA